MPSEKKRLCISGLQIHCLLILARQAHGIVGDLAWVSIGTLIRSGLNMGLHRDPKVFPKMSQMQGEIRKRLWASILEINLQLSLDMGLNPLISGDDYDTGPPGNFDDADLDDSSRDVVFSKPKQEFTQSTLQNILWESLILRMRVCKLINDFRGEPTYETVLELGGLLTKACKEATSRSYPSQDRLSQPKITQLQVREEQVLSAVGKLLIFVEKSFRHFNSSISLPLARNLLCQSADRPALLFLPQSVSGFRDYHVNLPK